MLFDRKYIFSSVILPAATIRSIESIRPVQPRQLLRKYRNSILNFVIAWLLSRCRVTAEPQQSDRSSDFPDRAQLSFPPPQRNAPPPAMQTWRRTFATSVARLSHSSPINSRSGALRCAQILQSAKQNAPCSLEDQEIKVNGFIRSVRKQKRFAFAEISDGSTIEPLQAILKPAQAAEYVTTARKATGIRPCPRRPKLIVFLL